MKRKRLDEIFKGGTWFAGDDAEKVDDSQSL
jgi:hypothetical protein